MKSRLMILTILSAQMMLGQVNSPRTPIFQSVRADSGIFGLYVRIAGVLVKAIPDSAIASSITDSTRKVPSGVAWRTATNTFSATNDFTAATYFNGAVHFPGVPAFEVPSGIPFTVTATGKVPNLNVTYLNGAPGTTVPSANSIPIADANGKLAAGWIPTTADSVRAAFKSDTTKKVFWSGIVATGTPDNTKFLRGDGLWSPPPSGGDSVRASFRSDTTKKMAVGGLVGIVARGSLPSEIAYDDEDNTWDSFRTQTFNGVTTFNVNTMNGIVQFINSNTQAPFTVAFPQVKVTNLHADLLDGAHALATSTANTIPIAKADGKLAAAWIDSANYSAATLRIKGDTLVTIPAGDDSLDVTFTGMTTSGYGLATVDDNGTPTDFALCQPLFIPRSGKYTIKFRCDNSVNLKVAVLVQHY